MKAADGAAVLFALLAAGGGLTLWAYNKLQRIYQLLIFGASLLAATGITIWTEALASLVSSDKGLLILAAVTFVSGISTVVDFIHRKKHHHRVRTPIFAAVFGTSLVLSIGSIGTVFSRDLWNPAKVGVAFGHTVRGINSGHYAQTASAMPHGQVNTVLIVAGIILLVFVVLAVKLERRRGGNRNRRRGAVSRRGRGGRPAVSGRRAQRAIPAGRRGK